MRSTLFFVPHEFLGIPLFGWGWALGITVVAAIIWTIVQLRAGKSINEIASSGLFWLVAIPLFVVVLPNIEQKWQDGTPIGLPIRGYGVMVLAGMLSGIAITNLRAKRLGISLDTIIGLGVWTMIGGVIGARIFFVVQKWDTFEGQGWDRMVSILKLTEGGLVIYGGMIGGLISGGYYCVRNKMPVLATADLIGPGFLLGLAFGRIGCLLHGCCYGGVCYAPLPSIQFPSGSLPYQAQVQTGDLLGMKLADRRLPSLVESLTPGGSAEQAGVKPGDELRKIRSQLVEPEKKSSPIAPPTMYVELEMDNGARRIYPEMLPSQSLPVHPSQIYSAIDALLLCALMWLFQPFPLRDGVAFFSGVIIHATSRFLIELIRSDESGQLGTQLTIAQLISIAGVTLSIAGLIYVSRKPVGRYWNWSAI